MGRGVRSYSTGAERLSTPLLSGQAIAELGRSLLSADAKMLLIPAIRSVRPPGAGDGAGTRPTGRETSRRSCCAPTGTRRSACTTSLARRWPPRPSGRRGQRHDLHLAPPFGPSDPLRWPFAQRTSSPEQASAVGPVSRSRSVGGRGFWRRRHVNKWAAPSRMRRSPRIHCAGQMMPEAIHAGVWQRPAGRRPVRAPNKRK
jgi:hypothetical protein